MKPLRITFEAFGSYPGKVDVDFTSLEPRGLFVISGDTGAGKSTIFDAMCFALYGNMPSKDAKEVRSHHADPQSATNVEFYFEVGGVEYRVTRIPEYERPKIHGEGTTKQTHKAVLERIETDGTTTPIETQVTNVKARCEELVGLSADQFMRVVLLPQGEVQKFLLAGSNERESLLGQLFGGRIYDRMVDHLKTESDSLKQQVAGIDESLRHHLATAQRQLRLVCETLNLATPEGIDALNDAAVETELVKVSTALEKANTEANDAQDIATKATQVEERAILEATRFDSARKLEKGKQDLDQTTTVIETNEKAAQASALARPVVKAEDDALTAEETCKKAKQSLQKKLSQIESTAGDARITFDISTAATITKSMSIATDDVREKKRLVEAVNTASKGVADSTEKLKSVEKELALNLEEVKTLEARIGELESQRPQLEQEQGDLATLSAAKSSLELAVKKSAELTQLVEKQLTQKQRTSESSIEAKILWDRFVATQAPRLAAELIDGDPCAVCGSVEHPSPATEESGSLVSFEQVEAAKDLADEARSQLELTNKQVGEIQVALGDRAGSSIEEIRAELAGAETRLTEANRAKAALEDLNLESQSKTQALNKRRIANGSLVERKDGSVQAVESAESRLEQAQLAAADIDTDRLDILSTAVSRLSELVLNVDTLFKSADNSSAVADERRDKANYALESSALTLIEKARAVLIEARQESTWIDDAKTHWDSLKDNQARYSLLIEQGIPEERPDSENLTADATTKKHESTRLANLHTTADSAATQCRSAIETYQTDSAGSKGLRDQHSAAHRAFVVCKNGGDLRIPLRRWVLANELDRVTAAANVHLQKMTAGRYNLSRIKEWVKGEGGSAFGLDLEVMDAHTGKTRRPNSLSGGEQFQASLALALGLADVVSHGGTTSGRNFDALFIDEGFGSLDERTLDLAIDTLHELHASGRMVGIITHVETMKQRLHVGIQVSRLENGDGSTLEVRV